MSIMDDTTHQIPIDTQQQLPFSESSQVFNDDSLLPHPSDRVISSLSKDNTDTVAYETKMDQIAFNSGIKTTHIYNTVTTKAAQILPSKLIISSSGSTNNTNADVRQESLYPLAQQSPPSYLKRFEFKHRGNTMLFDENIAALKDLPNFVASVVSSPSLLSSADNELSGDFKGPSASHAKIHLHTSENKPPVLKKRNISPQITEQPTHRRKLDDNNVYQAFLSESREGHDISSTTSADIQKEIISTQAPVNSLTGSVPTASSVSLLFESNSNGSFIGPSEKSSSAFSTAYADNTVITSTISNAPSPALSLPSPSASPFTVGPRDSVRIPSPGAIEGENDHEFENTENKTLGCLFQGENNKLASGEYLIGDNMMSGGIGSKGNENNLPGSILSFDSISNLIEGFDGLPTPLKNYVMYQLLQKCDRNSLSIVANVVVPALRLDILSLVPVEIASKILSHLDPVSLCEAAIVSKSWNAIVDGQKKTWKERLYEDFDDVTEEEVLTARIQKWSYTNWSKTPATVTISNLTKEQVDSKINIYKAIYRRRLLIHRIWMDPEKKPKSIICPSTSHKVITCLQFDDDKIVTGCEDHWISVYDTKTGGLKCLLQGHDGGVWALQFVGNILVSGSTDRTVRVWDIEKAKCTHVFTGHTSTVRCLDIIMPNKVLNKNNRLPDQIVTKFPPEPLIVTGSRDSTLRVWRLPRPNDPEYHSGSSASTSVSSSISSSPDPFFQQLLRGHSQSVRSISGYSDTVVSGSYDTTVRVWDLKSGKCRHMLAGHGQRVYSAVIDHKRNRCISGSMDWYVKVWCLEKGSCLYTLEGHTSLVGLLNLNGTTLVSAAADSTLRVWNPEDGTFIHKLEGHAGAVACFQHDDHKLVSGSESTIKLWDIKTGKHVKDLVSGCEATWQVRYNTRRCVAAVKLNGEARVIVLEFDNAEDDYEKPTEDVPNARVEIMEDTTLYEQDINERPLFEDEA